MGHRAQHRGQQVRVLVRIEVGGGQARIENTPHLRGQLFVDANALQRDRVDQFRDGGRKRGGADQHQVAADIERRIFLGQPHRVVERSTFPHRIRGH